MAAPGEHRGGHRPGSSGRSDLSLDGRVPAAFDTRVATLAASRAGAALLSRRPASARRHRVEAIIAVARGARPCVILEAGAVETARPAARLADGVVGLDESPEQFKASMALIPGSAPARLTEPSRCGRAIGMPADREAWRDLRREFADAGATGVIVPADPRLLDLLRNGDEDDDRSDLGLAQG